MPLSAHERYCSFSAPLLNSQAQHFPLGKGVTMPEQTRISIKLLLLVLALLTLPLALPSQNLFAAEEGKTSVPAVVQPQDLATFLDSIADQPLPGWEGAIPAPENKAVYCINQSCPIGQHCMNCNGNWVCIFDGAQVPDDPSPDVVCTGGSSQ
jgi:hypothetical protein